MTNIQLHYIEQGQGMPLIMLHGNGESMKVFSAFVQPLAASRGFVLMDSRFRSWISSSRQYTA